MLAACWLTRLGREKTTRCHLCTMPTLMSVLMSVLVLVLVLVSAPVPVLALALVPVQERRRKPSYCCVYRQQCVVWLGTAHVQVQA